MFMPDQTWQERLIWFGIALVGAGFVLFLTLHPPPE
jgi:hypothetical protein